jgi:lipopolysaccharide export system permease protein
MHGLTRYILRQSLGTTLFVTTALSAAIWLTQSLRLVDLIVNRGLSAELFFYLGLLIVPRFVDIVLPIGIFIAVLFTYNKLIAESEIVVMRAAGVSQFGLAMPAFALSGVGFVILFALSAYFLPTANRAFKDLQFEIRNKFVSAVLQEGTFTTISDNLTVYVRGRDTNGEMTGFLVQDERDPDKPVTIIAERGAFVETAAGSRVFLVNGNRQQMDRSTGKLSVLTFEKYTLDLSDARDATAGRVREPQERYLGELFFPRESGNNPAFRNSLRLEGHQRLIVHSAGDAAVRRIQPTWSGASHPACRRLRATVRDARSRAAQPCRSLSRRHRPDVSQRTATGCHRLLLPARREPPPIGPACLPAASGGGRCSMNRDERAPARPAPTSAPC